MTRLGPPRAAWSAVAAARGLTFEPGPGRCLGTLSGDLAGSELHLVGEGFGISLPGFGPAYDVETTLTLTLPDDVDTDDLPEALAPTLESYAVEGWDLVRQRDGWLTTEPELADWLDSAGSIATLVAATCGTEPRLTAGRLAQALRSELHQTGLWTPEPDLPRYRGGPFGEDHMSFEQWLQAVLVLRLDDIAAGHLAVPAESHLATRATREWDGNEHRAGLLPVLVSAVDRLAE